MTIVVACAGCDRVFRLTDPPGEVACPGGGVADSFVAGTPCAPWGRAVESMATMTNDDGELVIALQPNVLSRGQCQTFLYQEFADDGVQLDVVSIPTAPSGYVMLTALAENRADTTAELMLRDGMLILQVPGEGPVTSEPYAAEQMRWWRLRPDREQPGIRAEVSRDGTAWSSLGHVPGTIPPTVSVTFGAGTRAAEPAPDAAIFGSVRFCTPDR